MILTKTMCLEMRWTVSYWYRSCRCPAAPRQQRATTCSPATRLSSYEKRCHYVDGADTHDGPEFLELLDSSPASASASAASADAGAGAASSASTAAQGPKVTGFKSVQAALLHVVQPSTRELILGAVSEELAASSIMAWREREVRALRCRLRPPHYAIIEPLPLRNTSGI